MYYYEVLTISNIFGEKSSVRIGTGYQPHVDTYREMRGQPAKHMVKVKNGGISVSLSTFVIKTYKDNEYGLVESHKEILATAFRHRGHMHSPSWSYPK